ncbi:hypothetical protein ACLOJK_040794 [Asimina triloba]
MPSPPPLLSASRAFRRLLTCRNGVALLRSSGMNQEKFVGGFGILRALSSVVGIETPSVDTLTNSGRALSSSFLTRHNAVQGRSFLGCGDGEEGDMLSKTHEERRVLGLICFENVTEKLQEKFFKMDDADDTAAYLRRI